MFGQRRDQRETSALRGGRSRHLRRVIGALALIFVPVVVAVPIGVLATPEHIRLPQGEDQDEPGAVFSHWTHSQFGCFACHPSIFPQYKKTFTHDDMDNGLYCGSCHNGKTAFSYDDVDCETCHRE